MAEEQKFDKIISPVFAPGDFSRETKTPNIRDDEEAEAEILPRKKVALRERPWRVAKCLLVLRKQVNDKAPSRKKGKDGTIGDTNHCPGSSDHCPNIDDSDGLTGVVTAMDITHDPPGGCDAHLLANAIIASKDKRVKYIIWNRKIANSAAIGGHAPWTWRPYSGSNPHDKHVHISVKSTSDLFDATTPWKIFT